MARPDFDDLKDFDPEDLPPYACDGKGQYRLTCRRIHLTYPCQFDEPLTSTLESLERQLYAKNVSIESLSAVQETGLCRLIGEDHPHTHIALDLKSTAGRFTVNGTQPFKIHGTTPHVRLVQQDRHWAYIYYSYHRKQNRPHQRLPGAAQLTIAPLRAPTAREKAGNIRFEASKIAYDRFNGSGTSTLCELVDTKAEAGNGWKSWFVNYEDHQHVCEHYERTGEAAVIYNTWSLSAIIPILQEHCNKVARPNVVVFCFVGDSGATPENLVAILNVCDQISGGTLHGYYNKKGKSKDTALALWKPNVHVHATFSPQIHDLAFDRSRWTVMFYGHRGNTGHMLVASSQVDIFRRYAESVVPAPRSIISTDIYARELGHLLHEAAAGYPRIWAIQAVTMLHRLVGKDITHQFWRAGYEIRIGIYCGSAELYHDATQDILDGRIGKYIGKSFKVFNLLVDSIKLDPDERRITQERLQIEDRPKPSQLEELLSRGFANGQIAPRLLLLPSPENEPLPRQLQILFEASRQPFSNPQPLNPIGLEHFGTFLGIAGAEKGYLTRTPLGTVHSPGWIIQKHYVVIELDQEIPPKGEEYKILYWLEKGYRMIRVRQDDLASEEGAGGMLVELEHAILRGPRLVFLERQPSRNSWASLRERLDKYTCYNAAHAFWWKDNMDPELNIHAPDFFESIQTPRPATPEMTSIPLDIQQSRSENPHIPASAQAPQAADGGAPLTSLQTPRKNGWAIYTRTLGGDGLGGPDLERDINHKLAWQQNTCIAYAQKYNLAPVAGPHQMFADRCPPNAPFQSRPGLAALVASGAAGMLCVDCLRFSDGTGDPAGWLRAAGLEFRSVSGS
jgi:hypothetical protein